MKSCSSPPAPFCKDCRWIHSSAAKCVREQTTQIITRCSEPQSSSLWGLRDWRKCQGVSEGVRTAHRKSSLWRDLVKSLVICVGFKGCRKKRWLRRTKLESGAGENRSSWWETAVPSRPVDVEQLMEGKSRKTSGRFPSCRATPCGMVWSTDTHQVGLREDTVTFLPLPWSGTLGHNLADSQCNVCEEIPHSPFFSTVLLALSSVRDTLSAWGKGYLVASLRQH